MQTNSDKPAMAAEANESRTASDEAVGCKELLCLLESTAYDLWMSSLSNYTPIGRALYERMKNPKVGDVVMETTSWRRRKDDRMGFGKLVEIKPGKSEFDTVWTIEVPDGRRCNWSNAMIIAVPGGTFDWFPRHNAKLTDAGTSGVEQH